MPHPSRSKDHRSVFGIFLILLGSAFGARELGLVPLELEEHLFTWEMILLVLGLLFLFNRDSRTTGFILLLIGGIFWLPDVLDLSIELSHLIWPAVLIIIGFSLLIRRKKRCSTPPLQNSEPASPDTLEEVAIFGGGERIISSNNFQGGTITNIFGGSELDLRKAKLAPGHHTLELTAIFGGSTLKIPEDWDVRIEVTSIMGGFSDKRRDLPATSSENTSLTLRGVCIFGGGELKN